MDYCKKASLTAELGPNDGLALRSNVQTSQGQADRAIEDHSGTLHHNPALDGSPLQPHRQALLVCHYRTTERLEVERSANCKFSETAFDLEDV